MHTKKALSYFSIHPLSPLHIRELWCSENYAVEGNPRTVARPGWGSEDADLR